MKQNFVSKITEILSEVSIVKNLARKKFISEFVIGLVQSREVQFCEIAPYLRDSVKVKSNETRIQDFFREVSLNYQEVSLFLLSFLPRRRKLRLCIDRTNWDFGCYSCNILMVTVGCDDFTLPLYWELLANQGGNSSQEQRVDLLGKCFKLLGAKRIGLVVGDREFIGHRWLKYLKTHQIKFIMRMPKHHQIHRTDTRIQKIEEFRLEVNKELILTNVLVNGVVGHVSVQKLADGDYLYLFGTVTASFIKQIYRKRWTIEVCFQNFKGRGFNLENTHLQCDKKLKMLVALVGLTYALVTSTGIYHHNNVQKINTKNHGYKEKSFARKGIDLIREWARPGCQVMESIKQKTLIFMRYLRYNIEENIRLKIVG